MEEEILLYCFHDYQYALLSMRAQQGGKEDATRLLWRVGFTITNPFSKTAPLSDDFLNCINTFSEFGRDQS